MITSIGLYAIERKLEHVDDFWRLRDGLESCTKVIVVVKENATGAIGEFSH